MGIFKIKSKQEYHFLKQKYNLKEVREHHWQLMRIRPISFPTIRIAWFAKVLQQMPLMQNIISSNAFNILDDIDVSEYWNEHYVFDKLSKIKSKKLGKEFKNIIQINVFAPILFAYGRFTQEEKYIDNAIDLLCNIDPEINTKTHIFDEINIQQKTAFDTQALIELNDNYCSKKRCVECGIGHKILRMQNRTALSNIH